VKNIKSINKIKSAIHKEAKNNFFNHLKTQLRIVLWDWGIVYGEINESKFIIWKTDFATSIFYPIMSGEFDENGKVKISLRINLFGKIIYFLFSLFIISMFSGMMIKEASDFDHYLIAIVVILFISSVTFALGYFGNKVFKSKTIREFKEYLNEN
jgi:hypothetical protein